MIRLSRTARFLSATGLAIFISAPLHAADDTALPLPKPGTGQGDAVVGTRTHSWELPPIVVRGERPAPVRDDDLVGAYGQPRWSTLRRFSEVRAFVIPQGQAEFEYWLFVTEPSRNQKREAAESGQPAPKAEIKQQYELEVGLGHRLQLDLYQVYVKDGSNGANALDATKFELRYALADWGRIPGNPTVYGEWEQAARGADSAEGKLLLSDDINATWAWATNLVWEQRMGDNRDRSLEWNSAVGWSAIDQILSVGAEISIAQVSEQIDPSADERTHHWEVAAGPSFRLQPIPQAHVILSEFIGLNRDAAESRTVLIVGWEF